MPWSLLFVSHLWGPLLLPAVSYFLIHFSQSGDSPPGSFDPSPWISSNRTDGEPMTDLINWIASMWDLLSKETPLIESRISPFCSVGGERGHIVIVRVGWSEYDWYVPAQKQHLCTLNCRHYRMCNLNRMRTHDHTQWQCRGRLGHAPIICIQGIDTCI